MAGESPERLRLFLDATVLIKAASLLPRLPLEIMRLAWHGEVQVVLSPQVLTDARVHVRRKFPAQESFFERGLERLGYELIEDPSAQRVQEHAGLCRDASDVPVALAAIDAGVD